jgi:probable HAF family extracellular repeat protein
VNTRGQVVGVSNGCQDPNRPFLWENGGPMVNLNSLIIPGSEINMRYPMLINDRGEIGGFGRLPNDDFRAVLLIPCDGNHMFNHPEREQCDTVANNASPLIQGTSSPATQPASKETQRKLTRELLDVLRTQSGQYREAGARPHR